MGDQPGGQVVAAEPHALRLGLGKVVPIMESEHPQPDVQVRGQVGSEYCLVPGLLETAARAGIASRNSRVARRLSKVMLNPAGTVPPEVAR